MAGVAPTYNDYHVMDDLAEGDGPGRFTFRAILGLAIGLMGVGAIMTYSAAASLDRQVLGWPIWEFQAGRQMIFIVAGLVAMLVTAHIPYRFWTAGRGLLPAILLGVTLLLLGLVYVPGIGLEVNNARRWVKIGPESLGLRFQPSELAKILLPMFLAAWLSLRIDVRRFWYGLVPMAVVAGLIIAGVGIEDFGTAALLAAVTGAMLLVGGARIWHLMLLAIPAVGAFAYLLFDKAHRMQRLLTFMDIWKDPRGEGYQAVQSLFTISGGNWWGRGLGGGYVKTYLPEARTDFIFAVICEELGIVGAALVICLFIALIWQGLKVIRLCPNPVGRLLAFGITLTVGIQATMNIAVVTVSMPTKGISLPLVSAGGSGAIFLGALVGILAGIARTSDSEKPELLNTRSGRR